MIRTWGAAAAAVVAGTLFVGVSIAPSQAASSGPARQTGKIVSEEPVNYTPDILGAEGANTVNSITQVGNEIVVGGKFSQVTDNTTHQTLTRNNVFAFNAATGKVSTTFDPEPNGTVDKVQAGRDGKSVFLGGTFHQIAGASSPFLAKLTVSNGALNPAFTSPTIDGRVLDIENVGSRLWLAGRFVHVGGVTRRGIVALDPTSGKRSAYFDMTIHGIHNPDHANSQTFVKSIAVNPAQTEVVAIGNFTSINGKPRYQAAKFSLGRNAAALSSWTTPQFRQKCSNSFETNMTDVQYSPSGSYFVISSAGAYGGTVRTEEGISGCDVVTRFPAGTSTHGSRPVWTAYSGGDTTWTVELTDNVVYLGGHMRWENNPDTPNAAGPGAVSRQGIAALDPVNGLPYSWNPTRHPGVGVQDMLATDDGLYVGSDTDTFHHETHDKLAFVPLDGGETLPAAASAPGLPTTVYTVKDNVSPLVKRRFTGTKVNATHPGATGGNAPDWSTVAGAFMIGGELYVGHTDGSLTKQTFDGTTYGSPTTVATGDQIVPQSTWHSEVQKLTSIFYLKGFLYYTIAGSNDLHRRAFEVEDDLVGEIESSTPLSNPDVHGAFVAGGKYFFAGKKGYLNAMSWGSNGPTGKAKSVSGPGIDSQNWASTVAFADPNS